VASIYAGFGLTIFFTRRTPLQAFQGGLSQVKIYWDKTLFVEKKSYAGV
jgi:hypothetical protein